MLKMVEMDKQTHEALITLYVAIGEEIRQGNRDDTRVILSPYSDPDTLGPSLYILPIDGVSLEDVGQRSTITALVNRVFEARVLDDEEAPLLATFATELEQCAAKIRAFLAKSAPEEGP